MMQVHKELQARDDTEDWGGGWTAFPEYAHILRNPDGSIASVVPLAEIPGVKMHDKEPDIPPVIAPEKPEKVPMTRAQRHKFISVLAQRMFYYYKQLAKDYPGYHPFRDGLPDLPAGAPKNLQPKGETLYPATDAQIYDWLYKFCGQRATIINKKKHGAGIQDMAVRIE